MFREIYGYSQGELAKKLHMTEKSYGKLERGETKLTLEKIEQIEKVFGVNFEYLRKLDRDSLVCLINGKSEGDNNTHVIHVNSDIKLEYEIRELKLSINHKDELIKELRKQIEILEATLNNLKEGN